MEIEHPEVPQPRLSSPSGLTFDLNANGSIRRVDFGAVAVNLFPGNEVEGGPANVYLRCHGAAQQVVALLGPGSPARQAWDEGGLHAQGEWLGIRFSLSLVLAASAPAWFLHATLENTTDVAHTVDLVYAQDLALAPYDAVRLNEYYVSHYIDHTPLDHPLRGWVLASRQNLAVDGRFPWTLIGSLRRGAAFATDALQLYGFTVRAGATPRGLAEGLPAIRRQHEHSMAVVQDAPLRLAPGERGAAGFFGWIQADHPAATTTADLAHVDRIGALPEANPPAWSVATAATAPARTLFAPARLLPVLDLDAGEIDALFSPARRNQERDTAGLLSFFHGADRHVVLRAKELAVLRPHGHILRTGETLAPDESALTSTVWMHGVFASMVTQGHVSINRLLSTARSYLGLFRAHGQRVFVELGGTWWLLDVPSAFEMAPQACRWIYRHAQGCIEVSVEVVAGRHELVLRVQVRAGEPASVLICHHIALDGVDGSGNRRVLYTLDAQGVFVTPAADSKLGQRFPGGGFRIDPMPGTALQRVGGDELLFCDGRTRDLPYLCFVTAPATSIGLSLRGELVTAGPDVPAPAGRTPDMCLPPLPQLAARAAAHGPASVHLAQLGEMLPWYAHNALVHFLAPRGLEQYSGGGWGTRDVCQGPVEFLLALDRPAPVRALLLRVFRAQNADGDWPQWFTFFERERATRAGDSHGDVVFWPLLALAQYLLVTPDRALLDQRVPFFDAAGDAPAEEATIWQHVERALALINCRRIAGTKLASFGHGDWNDSLQPADPLMRERMCSAWTVTLHYQALATLASALRVLGQPHQADRFATMAQAVRDDFQHRLLADGVVAGYALFEDDDRVQYLLHPRDTVTGVRYSLLPMIHGLLNDMFSAQQARAHRDLIGRHLIGPDGARLFDRPLRYQGGPQKMFQRAETSAFFGREIGLMYTHAHLRYAEALAHAGDAEGFFAALCRAHPLGLREHVPGADRRQANCYFSSSDAAFFDRYQAYDEYDRVTTDTIALDGGWRIYSSGPGIALSIIVRRLLGIRREGATLVLDPVLPAALDGLRARVPVAGREIEILYRIGAGPGPTALRLNGHPLAFVRGTNPYRVGAAVVSLAEFEARCSASGTDRLEIDVG